MKKVFCAALLAIMFTPTISHAEARESVLPLLAKADVKAGEQVSHVCASCHTFDKSGSRKMGPNLYNIVNSHPAQTEGFAFSDAMKAISSKKWTYDALDRFLFDPQGEVPDSKMHMAGIKKTQDRANLIAWLRLQSDHPAPLPKGKK